MRVSKKYNLRKYISDLKECQMSDKGHRRAIIKRGLFENKAISYIGDHLSAIFQSIYLIRNQDSRVDFFRHDLGSPTLSKFHQAAKDNRRVRLAPSYNLWRDGISLDEL